MAEGDTIHRAAARISDALLGRVPDEILAPHPRHSRERWPQRLQGRALTAVDAHGKHLFVRFEGELAFHSHLRMTGAWAIQPEGRRWRRSPRRAWLVLRGAGSEVVQFDGPVLELRSDRDLRSDPRLLSLGQDVLAPSFDHARFLAALRRGDPSRTIADALLDQRTIAGIGNVWKSESCFAVGLDPWRATGEVGDEDLLGAVRFAREHMRRAAEVGHHARPEAVYGRRGQPCPRCGRAIRSRGQGENNRVTYWCPGCQH